MNRRAGLGGLLAAALTALVVILATSGGAGVKIEVTKGEPFQGASPVTRDVAYIAAQQRYLDRHPDVERRLERQSAVQEAAREGAVDKGVEDAGEEEQDRARAAGEEQGGESDEPGGSEHPLAAAPGDAPLETDIKEKPEPGEGTDQNRQSASAAPQERIGRAAIGPRSSLSEGTSFLGADSNDSGFIPPDSMGAVGPSQILVFVNGRMRLFDKQGDPDPNLDVSDTAFWTPVRNGQQVTAPGVQSERSDPTWALRW